MIAALRAAGSAAGAESCRPGADALGVCEPLRLSVAGDRQQKVLGQFLTKTFGHRRPGSSLSLAFCLGLTDYQRLAAGSSGVRCWHARLAASSP